MCIRDRLWSAEEPNLYTLVLTLKRDGKTEEMVSSRVGFRTVDVYKRQINEGMNHNRYSLTMGVRCSEAPKNRAVAEGYAIIKADEMCIRDR